MSPAPDNQAASASSTEPPHCRLEPLGNDAVVFRITRPAKLNAITKQVLVALTACLDEMERKGQRLLVVTAEGERAFCAGTDLAETQQMPAPARLAHQGGQELRAGISGQDAQLDLRQRHFHVRGRDPEGAGHRQLQAATVRKAIDRRHAEHPRA